MKIINMFKEMKLLNLLIITSCMLLLFSYNLYVNVIITILLFLLAIIIKTENLLYLFLLLSFFDDVLVLDWLGGSVSRIIIIIVLIRASLYIFREKCFINYKYILILLFFAMSVIVSFFTNYFSFECITIFLNVLALLLLLIVEENKNEKSETILRKIFSTILVSSVFACFFGLIHLNFLEESLSNFSVYRFNGTYEPNFMCFYIDIAIICLLGLQKYLNRLFFSIILGILVLFAGLTLSVTGILCLSIIFIVYFVHVRFNIEKVKKIVFPAFISVLAFFIINFVTPKINYFISSYWCADSAITENIGNVTVDEDTLNDSNENVAIEDNNANIDSEPNVEENKSGFEVRSEELADSFMEGDLDRLTSGRLPLAKAFLESSLRRNAFEFLFGNGPTTKMLFTNFFYKENYSHNSYMDILYNFGIVGFVIFVLFALKTLKGDKLFNKTISSEMSWYLKLLRVIVLIFGLSLSMYTKKMVLLLFFI